MAKKSGILSEEEILAKVVPAVRECVGWYDSKLSKERQRVLDYYNGKLPRRQHEGRSGYVSTDVYDSVESMKAQLLETFGGGDEIAQFDPDDDMSVDDCAIATKRCSEVIFRDNPGWAIFNDVIHDGLTARVGITKVFWEEKYVLKDQEFEGLSFDQAHGLASMDEVDSFDATLDEATGTYSGTLRKKQDVSKTTLLALAPEEFLVSPRAVNLEEALVKSHRTPKTRAQLIEMGLDKQKVKNAAADEGDELSLTPEALSRQDDSDNITSVTTPPSSELELITLYDTYITMVIDKAKGACLYRIIHSEDTLFEYEDAENHPFFPYIPLPIPHLFYGNNFAARVIPVQNARSVLKRAILDHASMTVNPRWGVVHGGLLNPREMLDNRLGGIVNMRRPDSVAPIPVPNLNAYVFELMKGLSDDNEKSTGISALSQGLNKDAISTQNSQGLVGDLVAMSTTREKIAARNFAYNYFTKVMLEVMRLEITNQKKKHTVEVNGVPQLADPSLWTVRKNCSISMHLGYGEKDKYTQKLVETHKLLSSDPSLQPMYTPQNRYQLVRDAMKSSGLNNAIKYITSPDKVTPPPPDPLKTKELEIKDKTATAAMATAQAKLKADQRMGVIDSEKLRQSGIAQAVQAAQGERDSQRHDLETANRIDVSQREMTLAETMPEPDRKAVIAPNS